MSSGAAAIKFEDGQFRIPTDAEVRTKFVSMADQVVKNTVNKSVSVATKAPSVGKGSAETAQLAGSYFHIEQPKTGQRQTFSQDESTEASVNQYNISRGVQPMQISRNYFDEAMPESKGMTPAQAHSFLQKAVWNAGVSSIMKRPARSSMIKMEEKYDPSKFNYSNGKEENPVDPVKYAKDVEKMAKDNENQFSRMTKEVDKFLLGQRELNQKERVDQWVDRSKWEY